MLFVNDKNNGNIISQTKKKGKLFIFLKSPPQFHHVLLLISHITIHETTKASGFEYWPKCFTIYTHFCDA